MSDEESDSEIWIDPSREEQIGKDVSCNLEVLNQKTINFEDLLNEFVRRGCLSFEEKFKLLSGIVDETTANKTIPEKCNELYQTLIRKKIPWAKVLKCWEETGNNYLVGRFDTHFTIEGRDSKSLKFSKFKALPSHRTEFLTHLFLKNVQLSPKSLIKCLRKSSRLQSIRLERVKVPHGGRLGDDPSSDFDLPLLLPNLKDFYFEEVTKQEPFESVKDVNMYLDELNLKPMIFFGLNSNMAWDVGIWICVKIRGVTILKVEPGLEEMSSDQQGLEDNTYGEYISMLRRRPVEYGGFINPKNCPRVSLYECYVPKVPFPPQLTHLTLYRCRLADLHPMISSCPNLTQVSLYGDYETNNVAQLDLASFTLSRESLKRLSIGMIQVTNSSSNGDGNSDANLNLCLNSLCIDCCKIEENFTNSLKNIFKAVEKVNVISCNSQVVQSFYNNEISDSITVYGYSWKTENETDIDSQLKEILCKGLKDDESNFTIEKKNSSWVAKKLKLDQANFVFEQFGWDIFCEKSSGCKGWFDLPFKLTDENADNPRDVFRKRLVF